MDLFLSLSMAHNVIACQKIAKFAEFAINSGLPSSKITKKIPKIGPLNRDFACVVPDDSSCPDGSEYFWQRGV